MIVLSPKPVLLLHVCEFCGAVLSYDENDIYEDKYIYCPVCSTKQECALQKTYDGGVQKSTSTQGAKIISG